MRPQSLIKLSGLVLSLLLGSIPTEVSAYSANKIFREIMEDGRIRISVQYTVPALKELRYAHAIFTKTKEADTFYWHLVQGGEFSVNGPAQLRFIPAKKEPTPW